MQNCLLYRMNKNKWTLPSGALEFDWRQTPTLFSLKVRVYTHIQRRIICDEISKMILESFKVKLNYCWLLWPSHNSQLLLFGPTHLIFDNESTFENFKSEKAAENGADSLALDTNGTWIWLRWDQKTQTTCLGIFYNISVIVTCVQ